MIELADDIERDLWGKVYAIEFAKGALFGAPAEMRAARTADSAVEELRRRSKPKVNEPL